MGAEPLGHEGPCARKALRPDLAPQPGLIRASLRQAAPEVRDIGINFTRAAIPSLIGRQGPAPQPAPDRVPRHACGPRDLAEALALRRAGLDLLIAGLAHGLPCRLELLEAGRAAIARQRRGVGTRSSVSGAARGRSGGTWLDGWPARCAPGCPSGRRRPRWRGRGAAPG